MNVNPGLPIASNLTTRNPDPTKNTPLANNLSAVSNSILALWSSFKTEKKAPINFNNFFCNKEQYKKNPIFQALINNYKEYPCKTVDAYHKVKNYPSPDGKDCRPAHFDLHSKELAAHGTNFEAVLRSIINCNMQIVPVIKQFKLQGKQPQTGESAREGTTLLNCKHVSTVSLMCTRGDFYEVKQYAIEASSSFRIASDNLFNNLPVVVIGEGKIRTRVKSSVSNELAYKRLNIRIVVFQHLEDKNKGIEWLKMTRDKLGIAEINSLKVCTFADLDACQNYDTGIDIISLWENSQRLE